MDTKEAHRLSRQNLVHCNDIYVHCQGPFFVFCDHHICHYFLGNTDWSIFVEYISFSTLSGQNQQELSLDMIPYRQVEAFELFVGSPSYPRQTSRQGS